MAKILIYACGRCGEPFRENGSGWFLNNQREWCHQCADGVIGGKERRDPAEPRPKLPDDAGRCDDLREQVSKSLAGDLEKKRLVLHGMSERAKAVAHKYLGGPSPLTATEADIRSRNHKLYGGIPIQLDPKLAPNGGYFVAPPALTGDPRGPMGDFSLMERAAFISMARAKKMVEDRGLKWPKDSMEQQMAVCLALQERDRKAQDSSKA